jgi:hypothetical protein
MRSKKKALVYCDENSDAGDAALSQQQTFPSDITQIERPFE